MKFKGLSEFELESPHEPSIEWEFSESENLVWGILRDQPKTRDSDKLLLLAYWQFECGAQNIDESTTPWGEFKKLLMSKDTYQPATIIRTRAKIQEGGYMWGKNRQMRLDRAEKIKDYMISEKSEENENEYQ